MQSWRYIEEDGVSADYGLATDEFLMSSYDVADPLPFPTLRLYTYRSHCALVGRFQNLPAEVHLEYCKKEGIQLGRRPTGGGAIIMGSGQLGVCLTTSGASKIGQGRPIDLYRRFALPIIRGLAKLGVSASFRPKNDLEVGGRKIAGLGVYINDQGAVLFHASLLVDLDISLMLRVLKIPAKKIADKVAIRSIRQRITTVSREADRNVPTDAVRRIVRRSFCEEFGIDFEESVVTPEEKAQIDELILQKYGTERWLYQRTPQADMTGISTIKTPAGLVRVYLSLLGETIKSVLITGDYFDNDDALGRLEAALKWSPLEKGHVAKVVARFLPDAPADGLQLSAESLTRAIWQAGRRAKAACGFNYQGSCYYPESRKPSAKKAKPIGEKP